MDIGFVLHDATLILAKKSNHYFSLILAPSILVEAFWKHPFLTIKSINRTREAKLQNCKGAKKNKTMSWQQYVDEHLMCDIDGNTLTAAAIIGHDGSVWSKSANFPQVRSLISFMLLFKFKFQVHTSSLDLIR